MQLRAVAPGHMRPGRQGGGLYPVQCSGQRGWPVLVSAAPTCGEQPWLLRDLPNCQALPPHPSLMATVARRGIGLLTVRGLSGSCTGKAWATRIWAYGSEPPWLAEGRWAQVEINESLGHLGHRPSPLRQAHWAPVPHMGPRVGVLVWVEAQGRSSLQAGTWGYALDSSQGSGQHVNQGAGRLGVEEARIYP